MTTTNYTAELPFRNHRIVKPTPMPRPPSPPDLEASQAQADTLRDRLKQQIETVFNHGFWYCWSCDRMTDRVEGENGQPAHCARCGSARIEWNPPVYLALKKEEA